MCKYIFVSQNILQKPLLIRFDHVRMSLNNDTTFASQNLDYDAELEFINHTGPSSASNPMNGCGFEIRLSRKLTPYLTETIIPTGGLVVVSWVRTGFHGIETVR